jgi:hypothetical protein
MSWFLFSKSWSSLPDKFGTLPKSFRQQCLVRTVEEDPDLVKERQELIKKKSVADLAQINSLSDLSPVDKLFHSKKEAKSGPSSR